jgi:tetratricopeptide (TPR) repeat protein
VSKSAAFWFLALGTAVSLSVISGAQAPAKQDLDHQYQSAVSNYEAGRYSEAASQLERLLPFATNSSTVHELLGLVYASLDQSEKAINELKTAVQLKPDWPEARTNLGTALLHAGKTALAGEQFSKALALDANSFDANHNMGEYYIQSGKVNEGRALLERAHQIDPGAYDVTYDLVMADLVLNRLPEGRTLALELTKQRDTAELRNLLGHIDEKDGKYVEAANDFEAAAHLDPTDDNLFDWGCEMLLHRTYEPAIAIFQEGVKRYPKSARQFIGLGLSLYSRGKYDDAVKALLQAADLNPSDPRCYLFLSKAYNSSPLQAEDVIQAFRRYAELQPTNALAQCYYAISLWKGKRTEDTSLDLKTIENLLLKSISLDDSLADAHVQLGNLYADQHDYQKSIPQYVRAIALNANLADAHYRLGTDYVHVGRKEDAQMEFAVYQKLRADHLDEVEKERDQVKQFIYSAKDDAAAQTGRANQ